MMMKNLLALSLLFFCFTIFAKPVAAEPLWEKAYWLKLGHYRPQLSGGFESDVDDTAFFLSPLGKTDPKAEFTATLEKFEQQNKTIICQFPARYQWLKAQVTNDWAALECPELENWRSLINPKAMTLVFPTAYMNSPSSMFGHTLLRIDAKDQTRHKELVAFAVNFAAEPDENDNAALYALKGLIGKYPGNFSLMPYYRKVREYSDIESRDIWEYPLSFSESEVERILWHLWEMQSATFDYYFADENCSYQLLALLQLARDDLDLTSSFSFHAIPSDTVAELNGQGLLQTPDYRPAFGTKLHHYAKQLTPQELAAAKELMAGAKLDNSQFTAQRSVAIYEVAYEWLNFNFYDQGLNRDDIAPRLTKLLRKRSQYKIASPLTKPSKPKVSPEQGHGSARVALARSDSKNYGQTTELAYRLAYHDLLDSSAGFIPGAQISFLDINASYTDEHLQLEHLYLIDAMSLAPDNQVFNSWSWNIRLGFDRTAGNTKRVGRSFVEGGYGKSIGDPNSLHAYLLGTIGLNGGDFSSGISPAAGVEGGIIWQLNPVHKFAVSGQYQWLANNQQAQRSQAKLSWHWALEKDLALRTEFNYSRWQQADHGAKLALYYYF